MICWIILFCYLACIEPQIDLVSIWSLIKCPNSHYSKSGSYRNLGLNVFELADFKFYLRNFIHSGILNKIRDNPFSQNSNLKEFLMSKFDRCIFISIAIGIWALAMTQIFKPNIVDAGLTSMTPIKTIVSGRCPEWIKTRS